MSDRRFTAVLAALLAVPTGIGMVLLALPGLGAPVVFDHELGREADGTAFLVAVIVAGAAAAAGGGLTAVGLVAAHLRTVRRPAPPA